MFEENKIKIKNKLEEIQNKQDINSNLNENNNTDNIKNKSKNNMVQYHLRIESDIYDKLKEICDDKSIPLNNLISDILKKHLQKAEAVDKNDFRILLLAMATFISVTNERWKDQLDFVLNDKEQIKMVGSLIKRLIGLYDNDKERVNLFFS